MGYDSTCTLTIEGRAFHGTAVLEHKALQFRGDLRLVVPLSAIKDAHADGDQLVIVFGGRVAELELGAQAEKWAKRITSPPSRADKLGVKAGMRIALVGMDDEMLVEDIGAKGALLETSAKSRRLNMIFFAANAPRDLARLGAMAGRLEPAGAIWLIRAKGRGAPISERESMAAGKQAGLVDVKVVSYSDTHSAEKVRDPRRPPPAGRCPRETLTKGGII